MICAILFLPGVKPGWVREDYLDTFIYERHRKKRTLRAVFQMNSSNRLVITYLFTYFINYYIFERWNIYRDITMSLIQMLLIKSDKNNLLPTSINFSYVLNRYNHMHCFLFVVVLELNGTVRFGQIWQIACQIRSVSVGFGQILSDSVNCITPHNAVL